MQIFAPNAVVARSRTWYFLSKLRKVKKANGQILSCVEVPKEDSKDLVVKNWGVWVRYVSRSGIHNMYKEYRDTRITGAVHQLYQEMASRHRARFSTIHIIKVIEVTDPSKLKRSNVLQFNKTGLKFPIPSRMPKISKKSNRLFVKKTPPTSGF